MSDLERIFKVNVNLSKSGDYLILNDDRKQRMIVNVNLIKHVLDIPYTKKDGTEKTYEEIQIDKVNAKIAYVEAASRYEEGSPEEQSL
jgi:hypothetical protein